MKSLRLGFSSRISPDFWILSGIEGTPEVRGGGCSPIAQHGGVRSPIAQHEAGGRGGRGGGGGDRGRSRPGAVQEAARYLREPTVGACLLIGTGKEEKSDYRENWAIGEGGGGEAVRVRGTAVPKGESVRGGFGVQRCQRGEELGGAVRDGFGVRGYQRGEGSFGVRRCRAEGFGVPRMEVALT